MQLTRRQLSSIWTSRRRHREIERLFLDQRLDLINVHCSSFTIQNTFPQLQLTMPLTHTIREGIVSQLQWQFRLSTKPSLRASVATFPHGFLNSVVSLLSHHIKTNDWIKRSKILQTVCTKMLERDKIRFYCFSQFPFPFLLWSIKFMKKWAILQERHRWQITFSLKPIHK